MTKKEINVFRDEMYNTLLVDLKYKGLARYRLLNHKPAKDLEDEAFGAGRSYAFWCVSRSLGLGDLYDEVFEQAKQDAVNVLRTEYGITEDVLT